MSCYISCWLFIYHAHYFYIMHVIHHRKKVRKTITENKRKLLGFLSGNIINPNKTTFNVFVPKFGYFTTVGFVKAISHDDLYSDFFWSEKIIWGVTSPLLNPAFSSSFTQFWECNCFPRCTNAFFRLGSFWGCGFRFSLFIAVKMSFTLALLPVVVENMLWPPPQHPLLRAAPLGFADLCTYKQDRHVEKQYTC